MLVPDNLKIDVVPARVRKPKDKGSVEGTVSVVSSRIIASLQNRKFFFPEELNQAVHAKFNNLPFTKREGSWYGMFQSLEKAFLHKLPTAPFELAQWKVATVQYNYHISLEKIQYSVPYEYIR